MLIWRNWIARKTSNLKVAGSCPSMGFIHLINEHEKLISKLVNEKTVQSTFFHDFKGAVKSLGAWGGDLVLVATNENYDFVRDYFKSKGFPIVIPYHDLVS